MWEGSDGDKRPGQARRLQEAQADEGRRGGRRRNSRVVDASSESHWSRELPSAESYPYDRGPDKLDGFKKQKTTKVDAETEGEAVGSIFRPAVEPEVDA